MELRRGGVLFLSVFLSHSRYVGPRCASSEEKGCSCSGQPVLSPYKDLTDPFRGGRALRSGGPGAETCACPR